MPRKGFSLVEVAMILLILAILAGAVTLSVRGTLGRVGMRGTVDDVKAFDRLARTFAREHDQPVRLVVDLAGGRLRRTSEDGRDELGEPLRLPSGQRIAQVHLAGRTLTSGSVAVSVSARGLSPTYALDVAGPGGRRAHLLVAGLSGQVIEVETGTEIEDAFRAIQARRDAR